MRERERETDRQRDIQTEIQRDKQRERERQRDRQSDGDTWISSRQRGLSCTCGDAQSVAIATQPLKNVLTTTCA